MKNEKELLKDCNIPEHIAFIMDGNGRWAKSKGKPRTFGHKEGSNALKRICKDAYEIGVKYVTVYAFSTENWKRPKEEVDYLMKLLKQFLKESIKEATKNNMRLRIIGDRENLPKDIQESIIKLEEASKDNTGLNLQIALNYGGKDEIIRGIKRMYQAVDTGEISTDSINEEIFSEYLDTKGIPEPDLMIRTSGEIRLSNYLLWQLAYSEFYFTEVYWPDFNRKELVKAILTFNKVERRFGGLA